jgi:hypothetical protein
VGEEAADLEALMQPCIDYARESFPEAAVRFDAGLPPKTIFAVVARDDCGAHFYVGVDAIDATMVHGQISDDRHVCGRLYEKGGKISMDRADLVDWLVIYPDRPEEGNLTGKYLLLRQDGLASGACDPQDPEFQHFRFFEMEYSFVPPDPKGWKVRGKEVVSGMGLVDFTMQEDGDSPNEVNTLYAARYESPSFATDKEFVEKLKEVEKKNLGDPDRYTLLEHDVADDTVHEARCARSHQVIEDRQALLSKSGDRGPMIREILSLWCVHPLMETTIVGITYTHRYQPGYRNPEFTERADTVFKSLAFKTRN